MKNHSLNRSETYVFVVDIENRFQKNHIDSLDAESTVFDRPYNLRFVDRYTNRKKETNKLNEMAFYHSKDE